MLRSRGFLGALAAFSLLLLLGSVGLMARRIDDYLKRTDHRLFVFQPVDDRSFSFGGRPVTIEDVRTNSGAEAVRVRYGEDELLLPATIPPGPAQLPGLVRHKDWMQVMRFVEQARVSIQELDASVKVGAVADHLALVLRTPPAGADHPELGGTFRQDWSFDFYEFKPEGGFTHESRQFPGWVYQHSSGLTREQKEQLAARKSEIELTEGTWEFYAALRLMPPLGRPNPKFTGDALPALGWTFPVAGFSALVLTLSIAGLLAPRSGRRTAPPSAQG